jgi:hypothetical protein
MVERIQLPRGLTFSRRLRTLARISSRLAFTRNST